jgi:hypothetical protein
MRQEVSLNRDDDKNSVAEANAWVENPNDLSSRAVAARTEASSSTMEITAISATRPDLLRGRLDKLAPDAIAACNKRRASFAEREVYVGFDMGLGLLTSWRSSSRFPQRHNRVCRS